MIVSVLGLMYRRTWRIIGPNSGHCCFLAVNTELGHARTECVPYQVWWLVPTDGDMAPALLQGLFQPQAKQLTIPTLCIAQICAYRTKKEVPKTALDVSSICVAMKSLSRVTVKQKPTNQQNPNKFRMLLADLMMAKISHVRSR